MAKIKITPTTDGRVLATFEDGTPFKSHSYKSRATAIQAIRVDGHTYDKLPRGRKPSKAKASKAKANKANYTFEDSTAFKLGYTQEQCAQMYAWIVDQRKQGVEGTLVAPGHTEQGTWAAFRVGKAMHFKAKAAEKSNREKVEKPYAVFTGPESVQETAQERVQKTLARAVENMEAVVNGSHPNWKPQADETAKDLGFASYKALKNAHKKAEGADRENLLGLRNICIRAANRVAA